MPRTKFSLVYKKQLIPKVHFLVFQTPDSLSFKPGQFFSFEVAPKTFRSYSTVQFAPGVSGFFEDMNVPQLEGGNYASFMISTKPGGVASEYFENVQVGAEITAIGPNGQFYLRQNDKPKAFIATGTGLAPFVEMISETLEANNEAKVDLFFGVWKKEDNFANQFFAKYLNTDYPNFKIYTVIDGFEPADLNETNLGGKVTTEIPKIITDFTETDFYMCGHPAMVAAMNEVLEQNGATSENVYMEKFGK